MGKENLFYEKQYFKQFPLWLILIGLNLLFIYAFFQQVIGGKKFGQNSMSNIQLEIATGIILLLTILFKIVHLDTVIKKDAIYIRFFPIQLNYRKYSWSSISKALVGKYKPILGYGGWGFRISITGKKALTVSGDDGIKLFFKDGSQLLIGTNKPKELEGVLKEVIPN